MVGEVRNERPCPVGVLRPLDLVNGGSGSGSAFVLVPI